MIECDDFDLEIGIYLTIMHSFSIMALIMNSFALYCVVRKSTKPMGVYKWYMLAYQMASTAFDFVYTGLTLPVIFFPIPMGYPGAWIAQWLSISTHASIIIAILTGSLLVASILNLFNYRRHLVTPTHHFLRFREDGEYHLCCEYSCAKSAMSVPQLTVFTFTKVKRCVMTIVALVILTFILGATSILLSFYFIQKRGNLSQKTRQMQRRFLIYLCIQVLHLFIQLHLKGVPHQSQEKKLEVKVSLWQGERNKENASQQNEIQRLELDQR
ncbi:unnamed protein product [Haemonchus placei]|uniref:7TM_GPCR_Srx domain-containing protein n=1 Tax=Haemonchus placei TaxID=6290 RepID=A0A0N4X4B8_HAEPC|nr:unnamed protein product [Haemonchus placei]